MASSDSETPLLDKFREYPRTPSSDPAEKILFAVIDDLNGRRSIKWALQEVDDDVMEELLQTNLELVRKNMT